MQREVATPRDRGIKGRNGNYYNLETQRKGLMELQFRSLESDPGRMLLVWARREGQDVAGSANKIQMLPWKDIAAASGEVIFPVKFTGAESTGLSLPCFSNLQASF